MSSLNVNDGGTFKQAKEVFVKDGGVWKQVGEVFVKDSGTWKSAFGVTYVSLSQFTPGVEAPGSDGLIVNFNLADFLALSNHQSG